MQVGDNMGNALEVKTMNRQQRRKQMKNIEWLNSLSKDKQEIINMVVQERAKEMARKSGELGMDILLDNIGTSISAALIYTFDSSEKEIGEFLDIFDNMLDENVKFVKREGKDWKMKLEKIEPKVLELVEKLLKEGVTKKDLVEKVRCKYPELTSGQIFNAYKISKEKIKEENKKNELTIDQAVDYIFKDTVVKEVSNNLEKEILEMKEENIKGALKNKLNEIATEKERTAKEIEILEKRLSKVSVDAENIEKAIELLKDVDL